ncbi:hypothetical protein [Acinetobacter junii]|uniref:hypothetical protein n=1 Tax=Acinetobacter junii TaxID=40215 RepID=UPI001F3635FF|nr:hypothetical protein [Acinetobacter junii]
MTNKSADLDYEIFLIDHLERFVFSNLKSYLHSPLRTLHPTLLLVKSEERFKSMIYYLHSIDLFKESEIEKQIRLYHYLDPETNPCVERDSVRKLDSEMLPKHYDEVLTAIKKFRFAVQNQVGMHQISELRKQTFHIYAFHQDTKNIELVPNEIKTHIEQTQRSDLSKENHRLKIESFTKYLEILYTAYSNNPKPLWKLLGFTDTTFQTIQKFHRLSNITNKNQRQLNELERIADGQDARFDTLIDYACKKANNYFNCSLIHHYEAKVRSLEHKNNMIDQLLGIEPSAFKSPYRKKRPKRLKDYFYPHNIDQLNKMKKDNNRIKSNFKTEVERLKKQHCPELSKVKQSKNLKNTSNPTVDHHKFTLKLLDSNPDLKMRLKKLI